MEKDALRFSPSLWVSLSLSFFCGLQSQALIRDSQCCKGHQWEDKAFFGYSSFLNLPPAVSYISFVLCHYPFPNGMNSKIPELPASVWLPHGPLRPFYLILGWGDHVLPPTEFMCVKF